MPSDSPSARFTRLYETLPPEAQRVLVKKQLVALLDFLPKEKSKKVIAAATHLKKRYAGIPVLDLKAKEKEINGMLDELKRDYKRSLVKGRSNKDELLEEAIQSLVDWMNDIWSVVYEHNVNFAQGHSCLLFAAEVLLELGNNPGGCKCSFMNIFVSFTIKKNTGEIVKSFSFTGAHKMERVLLWVWRELFLSMLVSGPRKEKDRIPEMLSSIEEVLGWQALQRLLYGGKKPLSDYDSDEENEENEDDWDSCDDWPCDEDDSDGTEIRCSCCRHADHWSDSMNDQRLRLRQYVQEHLTSIFKVTPSLALFHSLLSIAEPDLVAPELMEILSSSATNSSENFAAALEIHTVENNSEDIAALLESHMHLLRHSDASVIQTAVSVLSDNPFFELRSLQTLEKELIDTARTISAALNTCFSNINEEGNKAEMFQIIKLLQGSNSRHERIQRWVDAVLTPGITPPHPMALAAMMMGLPFGPVMDDAAEDADPMGYLDFDQNDRDLDDLRDELRPKLKERFDGWNDTATSMKGGPGVLLSVYSKLVELMPFMRAPDAVDEMISRLADKPSKHHICDALDSLSSFSKLQRKKMTLKVEKKRRMDDQKSKEAQPSIGNSSFTSGTAGFSFSFTAGSSPESAASLPTDFPHGTGGMEDVD